MPDGSPLGGEDPSGRVAVRLQAIALLENAVDDAWRAAGRPLARFPWAPAARTVAGEGRLPAGYVLIGAAGAYRVRVGPVRRRTLRAKDRTRRVTDTFRQVKRAAVVVHPGKHDDLQNFQSAVGKAMTGLGWAEPLWLETSLADSGEELARSAVAAGVDVVIASGGDGTITACVAGVAGTGVPLGVLPCGTGNLLARNLGLPLDLNAALVVALAGDDRLLDVGEANGQTFVVMAGLGFDAVMLAGTSELLKKHAGWLAYALSGLRHLWDRPTRMTIKADDGPPLDRSASGVIIGNVGTLQGNVHLLPDAVPDDGALDVAVLTAWGAIGWLCSPLTCCAAARPSR